MSSTILESQNPVIKLSRFRADVARALSRRGKALLEADDMGAQVQALAPLEAYFIIKEMGVDEALPILRHTTDEQLQACIDLDCWEGDNFSAQELDAWLAAFHNDGPEVLAEAFFRLDEEMQSLFIAHSMHILDTRSDNIPDTPDEIPRMETMDGFFVLISDAKLEREIEPFTLINALYRYDMAETVRLLVAAKWELPSDTQEQAWHFRCGRVADLGFPAVDEAARLFMSPPAVPPAPGPVVDTEVTPLPALYAAPMTDQSLVCRAMGHISDVPTLQRLENELVHLMNTAVVAYGDSPKDLQHTSEVAVRVRDVLSLGLEDALYKEYSDADALERAAADLLTRWPLLNVFQRGYQAVRPLHMAARQVARDPIIAAWLNITLSPDDDPERLDRCFLRGLVAARPLMSGYDPQRAEKTRTWSTRADVQASRERLDALSQKLL